MEREHKESPERRPEIVEVGGGGGRSCTDIGRGESGSRGEEGHNVVCTVIGEEWISGDRERRREEGAN